MKLRLALNIFRPILPLDYHSRSGGMSGCSSVVELFVANEVVVSSNLITRSKFSKRIQSIVVTSAKVRVIFFRREIHKGHELCESLR